MDAQEDKKVDDVSEGKKFGPCMNCGYPRTAHDWKIPGRYCSNYLARDPAPAQPVADAQGETAQGEQALCSCPDWFNPVGRYTHHVECPLFIPFGDMVAQQENAPQLYYIQDTRSYTGNSVMWWRPDGNGYTSDLAKAWKVSKEKAEQIMRRRQGVDKAWPCEEIDSRATCQFDMQLFRHITAGERHD